LGRYLAVGIAPDGFSLEMRDSTRKPLRVVVGRRAQEDEGKPLIVVGRRDRHGDRENEDR